MITVPELKALYDQTQLYKYSPHIHWGLLACHWGQDPMTKASYMNWLSAILIGRSTYTWEWTQVHSVPSYFPLGHSGS